MKRPKSSRKKDSSRKPYRKSNGDRRKTLQLCGQISREINYVLAGECDDDILRNLYVVSIEPAPDASRLLVNIGQSIPDESLSKIEILQRLNAASGKLRFEIAHAINRRRVPELMFCIANPIEESLEEELPAPTPTIEEST